MSKEEIEEPSDHWKDEKFAAELERRETAYRNGTAKNFTLDQAVANARASVKKVKNK